MAKKKDRGWIKLYRQISDSAIWTSPEPFDRRSAWLDLLMMANHEQRTFILKNGHAITLEAGQLFTSMDHLADRWHWSRQRVIRYLTLLSEQGMCTRSGTTNGTTLTIVKYGFFQGGRTTNDTTDDTTDGTTGDTTDGTRTRTNNKNYIYKNEKQEEAARPLSDSLFSSGEY